LFVVLYERKVRERQMFLFFFLRLLYT